jgi:hypothetical protein
MDNVYKVQHTETRPSVDIPWFNFDTMLSEEYRSYIASEYLATGKIFHKADPEQSEDGLTLVTAVYWRSKEDFQAFSADPTIIEHGVLPRLKYNNSVNITRTRQEFEQP